MLTFEQIKELIELIAQRQLQGMELERSGFRLKIDGRTPAPAAQAAAAGPVTVESFTATGPSVPAASAPSAAGAAAAAAGGTGAAGAAGAAEGGLPPGTHVLNSPIVGTFYRAPSPDADPFTEVGARVKKGQVLCIIEAMKLMNEIESDVDGVVLEVYPQNAQAVEFGEPLFAIRPS